jgi:hypothetical protein
MYDLIERSQCRLRTLKGVNVNFLSHSINDLTRFFSHPRLQDLETLLVYRPNQIFFQAITLPFPRSSTSNPSNNLDSPSLFPRLKNLDIVAYRADTGVEFSQMIVSRFEYLKKVRLSGSPPHIILLEGRRVWDFPGIVMDVKHDFSKRETLWNDYALFGGAWNQTLMDQPMVRADFCTNQFFVNRFGCGDEWYRTDRFCILLDGRREKVSRRKGFLQLSDDV